MASFGVELPIRQDSSDGFAMIKNIKKLATQNLKMLILTAPGERVMEPEFGVGVREFLFEHFGPSTYSKIENKIREQVEIYMPIITIEDIQFSAQEHEMNQLQMHIKFSIADIGLMEMLEFTI